MPLQTSGPISLANVAAEFGGSAPHSMSEYYGVAGLSSSGILSLSDFYGLSNYIPFSYTYTSNQQEVTINDTTLSGLGWDGLGPVTIEVPANVYLWSDSRTIPALSLSGTYPNGITLVVDGYIIGKGGTSAGGTSSTIAAESGGPALSLGCNCTITGNGYVAGGGGGGGNYRSYTSSTSYSAYSGGGGAGGGQALYGPTVIVAPGAAGADGNYAESGGGAGGAGA